MFVTPGSRAGRKRIAAQRVPGYAIADGAGFAINPGNGAVQVVSLAANRTPVFSGWIDGDSVLLYVRSNGFTLDYSSLGVLWEGNAPPRLARYGVTEILFERYAGVMIGSDPNPTANEVLYVGGIATTGQTGAGTTTPSNSLTALTGGIDTTARAGDFVVNLLASAGLYTADLNMAMNSAGYTEELDSFTVNGTNQGINLGVSYKVMGATPDTTCVGSIPANTNGSYAQHTHVFRNVDPNLPFDVPIASVPNTANGRPDPGAVVAASAGSMALVLGAIGSLVNPAITSPGSLSAYTASQVTGTSQDTALGSGVIPRLVGPVDLTNFGATLDTNDCSIAVVLVLRALR